ncbi:hypothetical protein G7051_07760 [Dysgonomonas sp. HDW5B]|uniref:hypothetical protein n=1 Tax=Dysgonomonas sp. HDW5B TaxID=2714927 RepID=UPI00140AF6C9|nr:hypothetical protein [Dysgonomonas sp. HDW5B]QIK54238.1 hypothetical protein G7051_07760 [Dysgonomonas sp. HDW5B]
MINPKIRTIAIVMLFLIKTGSHLIYAQGTVGINTTEPEGVLDVVSSNSAIILPRNTNPTTNVPLPKAGMIIYNSTNKYVQYFDGTAWVNPQLEPWMVSGTTNKADSNTENIYQIGNVGIGTNIPTNKLHISDLNNPIRIQGLSSGVTSDSLVSIDASGIVKRRSVYSLRKDIVAPPTVGETPFKGMIRFNTTANTLEYYEGTTWVNPQLEPWMVSGTTNKADLNTQNIYQIGNVGVGTNIPTNKLHISDLNNPIRIQGLSSGVTSDSLVSIDASGIVKRRSVYSLRKDIVAPPTVGETPFKGMIRFNTTTNTLEYYDGTTWQTIASNSFGGKNEGVVRIDGSNGNTSDKPVIAFTNPELGFYKYINYTTPLARPFAFWPENITPPITDANIVSTYNSNTTFVENSIIGQVHTWRINATFADKPSGTGGFITIRFTNPISGFVLQQYVPCQTNTTNANFTVNFITVADQASLPPPLGTGSGYNILITTDVRLTITIQSITRVSAYKD